MLVMAVNELQDTNTGVIVRDENGRFVKGTKPNNVITSSEHARSMVEKRWQMARERTASRIMKEAMSIDPDVKDEYDAHALMMAKQYTTIIDSDKPRMDDAIQLAQAMGTMPTAMDARQAQQVGTVTATAEALNTTALLLESVYRDVIQRQAQVVEGVVSDSET